MYHSGRLFSLQYVDKLLVQLEVSLIAKLLLQPKTNIGKTSNNPDPYIIVLCSKRGYFSGEQHEKNLRTLKDVVHL